MRHFEVNYFSMGKFGKVGSIMIPPLDLCLDSSVLLGNLSQSFSKIFDVVGLVGHRSALFLSTSASSLTHFLSVSPLLLQLLNLSVLRLHPLLFLATRTYKLP